MYHGHKQDRVGVLTDKLVDGHEKLAGARREKGCWGPGRLGPALAPRYDARDDDDRRDSAKGREGSWALLLGYLLLCGKQGGDCVVGGSPCGVCFPHTVGATLLLAHPVGCSAVRLSI